MTSCRDSVGDGGSANVVSLNAVTPVARETLLGVEKGTTLNWWETLKMVVASSKESIWETCLSMDMAT